MKTSTDEERTAVRKEITARLVQNIDFEHYSVKEARSIVETVAWALVGGIAIGLNDPAYAKLLFGCMCEDGEDGSKEIAMTIKDVLPLEGGA